MACGFLCCHVSGSTQRKDNLMCVLCARELSKKMPQHPGVTILKSIAHEFKCPAMKALEDLTPSGSEFVNDPTFCHAYLRRRLTTAGELLKQKTIHLHNMQKQIDLLEQIIKETTKFAPTEMAPRTCKYTDCGKITTRTAFGLCTECGRFQ
jgi:hypothetical protein